MEPKRLPDPEWAADAKREPVDLDNQVIIEGIESTEPDGAQAAARGVAEPAKLRRKKEGA